MTLAPPLPGESIRLSHYFQDFPCLKQLYTCPQDSFYHAEGDVGIHTEMVCNELLALPQYKSLLPEQQLVVFYSCLLHDIAKPLCTKLEDDGRITSKGHSKAGAIDARILLWKKKVPFILREQICSIIEFHQVPFFAFNSKQDPDKLAIELSWQTPLDLLCLVAQADMRGRFFVDKESCLEDIALFEELAKELQCFDRPYPFPNPETKIKYFEEGSCVSPEHAFYKKTKSTVYILSGLPASGKSSWVTRNKHLPCVSFDNARQLLGIKHGHNDGEAVHLVIDTAKQFLREGRDFIWDATHLSKQMRSKTLDLVHRYDGKSVLVYFETSFENLLSRNNERDSSLSNKKLQEMFLKWEVPKALESYEIQYEFS